MAYQITCTVKNSFQHPHYHEHIVQVGTGDRSGWSRMWTVDQVYATMDLGETFYTVGNYTGKIAIVGKYQCPHCSFRSLRTAPDDARDNNLDNLVACKLSN